MKLNSGRGNKKLDGFNFLPDRSAKERGSTLLYQAWKKLIVTYLSAFAISFAAGFILNHFFRIEPKMVFELSTKRMSYALPVFQMGLNFNLDIAVLIFFWNAMGALITLTFIYTASLFNPHDAARSPRWIRKFFCGSKPMKILCFLPGCKEIKEEPIRRLYVWLMVPLLGLILLGVESGLSISSARYAFGSYLTGMMTLLPHGIIEIPAFALAGATAFAGHLMVKEIFRENSTENIFRQLAILRAGIPIQKIGLIVIGCLLLSSMIEGHVTPKIIAYVSK